VCDGESEGSVFYVLWGYVVGDWGRQVGDVRMLVVWVCQSVTGGGRVTLGCRLSCQG